MKTYLEYLADAEMCLGKEDFEGANKAMNLAEAAKRIEEAKKPVSEPVRLPFAQPEVPPVPPVEDGIKTAAHVMRFGALGANEALVMKEVYGGGYAETVDAQTAAFKSFIRRGTRNMSQADDALLRRQLWPVASVKSMLNQGVSVAEIKATMVEGADVLGGFAVPPQLADAALARVAGLTAVRGGGATVVQTVSNMIEWVQVTGGTTRYPSALRGAWGTEIQAPAAKDFTLGMLQIPVNLYTFKVPMSVSLVEDATNCVDLVMKAIADTLYIDEDEAFLRGDGANKPRGILPGLTTAANTDDYTHAASGSAATLTWAGLNDLRRALPSQYRAVGRATMIGNSATGSVIESLVDGSSRPYMEELTSGVSKIKGATWRESEAMDTPTNNNYPLIYADLSGYAIVEKLGLSIQRYNDSATGINVVEFHVRRRIGGHVVESYKIAVQKTEA